jgi:cysteinyl-tRNA synthetase
VDEAEPKKRYPFDFALWKAARPDEMSVYTPWDSPWGPGRPGWHIECSAMVRDALGETIDIHMGGMDLIFPHHENEIAQSEAATRQPLARYWLHNGFVNIDSVKMSKSLGNFKTIRDLLQIYEPMVLRLFVLQASYRKPIDFTEAAMTSAKNSWHTLRDGLLFGFQPGATLGWPSENSSTGSRDLDAEAVQRFQDAMDDDLNTPVALSVLFELAKDLKRESNRLVHEGQTETSLTALEQQWKTLCHLASVLGLEAQPNAEASNTDHGLSGADIEALIQQRQAARQAKNFAEGDRIRNELEARGITLIDQPGGITRWHR